ncbi:hypothetical protein MTO96_000284 [Rhipicephalus appendiculatus]
MTRSGASQTTRCLYADVRLLRREARRVEVAGATGSAIIVSSKSKSVYACMVSFPMPVARPRLDGRTCSTLVVAFGDRGFSFP